jgi:hypothetical protein
MTILSFIPDTWERTLAGVQSQELSQVRHIPLDDPIIARAKALIPEQHWTNSWVAGSAATRYPQNADVDVWVSVEYMRGSPQLDTIIPGGRRFADLITNAPKVEDQEAMEMYMHLAWKAIDEPGLQIMVTQQHIGDLLAKFDISCHVGAVNIVTGEQLFNTNYSNQVKIVNFGNPIKTLARYFKFAERYKDWSRQSDPKVAECAASAFNLYTYEQMRDEMKYMRVDTGL